MIETIKCLNKASVKYISIEGIEIDVSICVFYESVMYLFILLDITRRHHFELVDTTLLDMVHHVPCNFEHIFRILYR